MSIYEQFWWEKDRFWWADDGFGNIDTNEQWFYSISVYGGFDGGSLLGVV